MSLSLIVTPGLEDSLSLRCLADGLEQGAANFLPEPGVLGFVSPAVAVAVEAGVRPQLDEPLYLSPHHSRSSMYIAPTSDRTATVRIDRRGQRIVHHFADVLFVARIGL